METKEQNKLIAEFMGWKEQTDPTERWLGQFFDTHGMRRGGSNKEPLLFHSSWDCLMPVVERIESLGHGVTIYRKGCHINNTAFSINGFSHSSKIEQTYKAVIEFINWYNQQNQD